MSLHTLIFLPPTTTWWAFVVGVLVWAGACNAVGIGGGCHDSRTGEVLKEVEDANGKVWPVKKHPQTLKFGGPGTCILRRVHRGGHRDEGVDACNALRLSSGNWKPYQGRGHRREGGCEGSTDTSGTSITTTDYQILCLILRIRPRAKNRGTLMAIRIRFKSVPEITLPDKPSL